MQLPHSVLDGEDFAGTERFQVLRRIGEGAVGVVYEALDRERGLVVALKMLRTASTDGLLSLKREFRVVADVRHANLVRLGELFEAQGVWFFTMELVKGVPFTQWVVGDGAVGAARLRRGLAQLVEGLSALHAAGKVHLDIKPSNVLVTPDGQVVILDFGVSADLSRAPHADVGLVGTAAYMAPEQLLGEPVSPASDWYAVGVMTFEALTGRVPFEGSFAQLAEQKLTGDVPRPSASAPGIPADLDQLCLSLLAPEPASRPDAVALRALLGLQATSSASPHPSPLVGRKNESDQLVDAFAETREGRGVAVVLAGESGVGKSFLVRNFLLELATREPAALVLTGRCYERESVPYKAFDAIVDQLSSVLEELSADDAAVLLPPGAELLLQAFPVLESLRPLVAARIASVDVQNPQERRARLFGAVRELLRRIAQARPLVLTIDDLQWADQDSLELLHEVLRTPEPPPLLLIGTQRVATHARGSLPPSLPAHVRHISLSPLHFDDACRLAYDLMVAAGEHEPTDAHVRRVVEDAQGHPLFIHELVRQRAAHHAPNESVRLDEALWSRIAQLSPPARRVLELLAVAGVPLGQSVIVRATALDPAELFEVGTTLRAEDLVRSHASQGETYLDSYHDRIRESVIAHLDAPVLEGWHFRLALALEHADSDPESIALHWQGAGRPDRAAGYLVQAAEQAAQALAFERAARLYQMAIDTGEFKASRLRELQGERASALRFAGLLLDAAEANLALASSAEPVEQLERERLAAEQFLCSGHYEQGFELVERALRRHGVRNPRLRFDLIGSLLFHRRRLDRALRMPLPEARSVDGSQLARVDALWSAAVGYATNDTARGSYFMTRCAREALEAGDPHRTAPALGMHIVGLSIGGLADRPQITAHQATLRSLTDTNESPMFRAFATGADGFVFFGAGEWTPAKQAFLRSEQLFRDHCVGYAYNLNSIRGMLFRTMYCLGELRELGQRLEPILRQAYRQQDRYMIIVAESAAGSVVAAAEDRIEDAERAVLQAHERLNHDAIHLQHYWVYTAEAQVALYRGDAAAAYERMAWLWPAMKRALLMRIVNCRIVVRSLRARAAIALAHAEPGRAMALLREARADAQQLEKEHERYAQVTGRSLLALIALAQGQREEGLQTLSEAAQGFRDVDMQLCAAAASRLEAQLRGGDEGRTLIQRAEKTFAAEGVVDADRMTSMVLGVACR